MGEEFTLSEPSPSGSGFTDKAPHQEHEQQAAELSQLGRHSEALQRWEQALKAAEQSLVAVDDDGMTTWRLRKRISSACNTVAMAALQQGQEAEAMTLLKRALAVLEPRGGVCDQDIAGVKLRAITYNNIGCFYRKKGLTKESLVHLERALRMLSGVQPTEHAADAHLNICAVLSEMKQHSQALEHAQVALILLQEELYFGASTEEAEEDAIRSANAKRYPVLAIAYHNVAVEQEFLGRHQECLTSYQKAYQVATEHMSDNHPIAVSVTEAHRAATALWCTKPTSQSRPASAAVSRVSISRPASASAGRVRPGSAASTRSTKSRSKHRPHATSLSAMTRMSRGEPSVVRLDSLHSLGSLEKSAKRVPHKKRLSLVAGADLLYGDDEDLEIMMSDSGDESEML